MEITPEGVCRVPGGGSTSRSVATGMTWRRRSRFPPPLRRHPGGRPDRGGRPHPTATRRNLPSTLAFHERPDGPPEQGAAASSPGGGYDAGTSASTRWSTSASPIPGCPDACGSPTATSVPSRFGSPNPLSAEHSVERTALVGSLLDAASYQTAAHGARADRPLRVQPRLPARGAVSPHDGRAGRQVRGGEAGAGLRALADWVALHRCPAPRRLAR